ncbi:hypothetical protein HU200_001482 [Digitaria exilis]|uniref:Uncharacterized protein n=1 Tax=Digitaria exilis TaxID=1010633 RepID=A0A835KUN2_9POAL|nr:hypothetical protein HU200_001482 [Digitaria exilis]
MTMEEDGPRAAGAFLRARAPTLDVRAFYLRLSTSAPAASPPAELALVYHPAIGGAALALNGRALPPTAPAEVPLRRVAGDAYASADHVAAAEGARFEVYAGKEMVAEGVFRFRRRPREGAVEAGWRVQCRRAVAPAAAVVAAEVVVLAEGGVLMRDRARAATSRRGIGCGATRLEGIPEEATDFGFGCGCRCGDEEWEVVAGESDDGESWKEEEVETVRWAMEMGVWAVCLGVGLLATASRFRRKRDFW